MQIAVNGEKKSICETASLEIALDELQVETRYFAVAINRVFVPKSLYATTMLKDGDELEILSPMQGG